MPSIRANYKALEGSERRPAPGARLIGPADPNATVAVTIRIRPRPIATGAGKGDPGQSGAFENERNAQRSTIQSDIDRVVKFLSAEDLKVVETNVTRRSVIVTGTVEQMSRAFAVELGTYQSPSETYRGREGFIYLPTDLAAIVEGVFGLDERRVVRPLAAPAGAAVLTPPQVAQLYNFPTAGNAAGQTIGILEFGGGFDVDRNGVPTDIKAFFDGLGLGTPTLTTVGIDGATNSPGSDLDSDTEVALDIDVCGSVAQAASLAVYFAPNSERGFLDAAATAVHPSAGQPTPSVISISWGGSEGLAWTAGGISALSGVFAEAVDLGLTILVSSGDKGTDCGAGDGIARVEYPASDPFVTACGGTIVTDVRGLTFSEGTWNDDSGATGGGISTVFPLPSWQVGIGVPVSANAGGGQGRGIPDIAGNASQYSGYNIPVHGSTSPIGGTSAVAPLYAGLIALINARLGIAVGYLNPMLYAMPGGVFQDINDGVNNRWSGEATLTPAYTSGRGWDACTGWGSVNGSALMNALETWVCAMHVASI
jgi:kumamolisin